MKGRKVRKVKSIDFTLNSATKEKNVSQQSINIKSIRSYEQDSRNICQID